MYCIYLLITFSHCFKILYYSKYKLLWMDNKWSVNLNTLWVSCQVQQPQHSEQNKPMMSSWWQEIVRDIGIIYIITVVCLVNETCDVTEHLLTITLTHTIIQKLTKARLKTEKLTVRCVCDVWETWRCAKASPAVHCVCSVSWAVTLTSSMCATCFTN